MLRLACPGGLLVGRFDGRELGHGRRVLLVYQPLRIIIDTDADLAVYVYLWAGHRLADDVSIFPSSEV